MALIYQNHSFLLYFCRLGWPICDEADLGSNSTCTFLALQYLQLPDHHFAEIKHSD